MLTRRLHVIAISIFLSAVIPLSGAWADCSAILPASTPPLHAHPHNLIKASDLVRIRDIIEDPAMKVPAFSISPDGGRVAFRLQRADPSSNSYCVALVVAPLKPKQAPRVLDVSNEFVPYVTEFLGMARQTLGTPLYFPPLWSPDGQWLAYLRRERGTTQVRIVSSDGRILRTLTRSPVDVEEFAWSADGRSVIWASRTALADADRAIAQEALRGFHFDKRFSPAQSNRPIPGAPLSYYSENVETGEISAATAVEKLSLIGAQSASTGPARHGSNVDTLDTQNFAPGHRVPRCGNNNCFDGATAIWPAKGGGRFVLRSEGWSNSQLAMYRVGRSGQTKRLWTTDDLFSSCQMVKRRLLCTHESSTTPRDLSWLDPESGQRRIFFDANPEFKRYDLGTVTRLKWKNDEGLDAFGDLVLPPGYHKGDRLPLVIVGYRSRGFLRGGVGDEYPIFPLAAQGFAVLSFDRPPLFGLVHANGRSPDAVERANHKDFADRQSVQSALMVGIQKLEALGVIDARKLGITGLSDGAATVEYALLNSHVFAAAAESNCCADYVMLNTVSGPATLAVRLARGIPPLDVLERDGDDPRMSFVPHAATWTTPLLIQESDSEYLYALRSVEALLEHKAPVDFYVFPNETHIKWQPAHKLAVYRRSIAWFNFWLRGVEHKSDTDVADYPLWRSWKNDSKLLRSSPHSLAGS